MPKINTKLQEKPTTLPSSLALEAKRVSTTLPNSLALEAREVTIPPRNLLNLESTTPKEP